MNRIIRDLFVIWLIFFRHKKVLQAPETKELERTIAVSN